jgi:hypothetical protein
LAGFKATLRQSVVESNIITSDNDNDGDDGGDDLGDGSGEYVGDGGGEDGGDVVDYGAFEWL